jgi:putative aldouronate transport system permease protein
MTNGLKFGTQPAHIRLLTTVNVFAFVPMFAYAFSRPYLKGRRWYAVVGFTSMYFSGGLIPTFMLINWLGLYDSYWVYIIPSLFGGFWNVIILNANYKAIPDALFESSKMDGASEFTIFFRVVLPLSKPVLAALSVFTAVGIWNDYGTTLYFTQSSHLQNLQYIILKLLQTSSAAEQMSSTVALSNPTISELLSKAQGQGLVTSQTIELASMVIASIPMIIMYPFAQRFFTKGVLLGSVKG